MKIPQIKGRQGGFTLIELIVVMVILGILAAFAIPRFANLTGEARAATAKGAKASVQSAATIVRSKWLAIGGGTAPVQLEGETVAQNNGYPTPAADGICNAIKLDAKLQCDAATAGTANIYYLKDDTTDKSCGFTYTLTPATGTATDFVVTDVVSSNC